MIPRPFVLHSPTTISEAVSLLKELDDPKVLAGGQSLVPMMKLRDISPANIVDIGRIPGLSYIKREKGLLRIGSMTTHHDVAASPLPSEGCETLSEAASLIGDRQVRNRGTIGGAICFAHPAADVPAAAVALDAEFTVAGPRQRVIKAKDFFTGVLITSLLRSEILVEVSVPIPPPPRSGGAYVKLGRGASDSATIGVAARVTLDKRGACSHVGLGLAGAGQTPLRAVEAEEVLTGEAPTDEVILEAAERASEMSKVVDDIRGSAEYKREMVKVYVGRAIRRSLSRVR